MPCFDGSGSPGRFCGIVHFCGLKPEHTAGRQNNAVTGQQLCSARAEFLWYICGFCVEILNCTAHRCGTRSSHNQAKCHWIKKSSGVAPGPCPLIKNPFLVRRMATHWMWKNKRWNQTGFMKKWPLSPVGQERTVWLGSLVAARCLVFGLGLSVQLDPATRNFDSQIQSFFRKI